MENNVMNFSEMSSGSVQMVFSQGEELECFQNIRSSLVKLLFMIEEEGKYQDAPKQQDNNVSVDLWLTTFLLDLSSSNKLCHNKLTKVIVKIHALYDQQNYQTMTHAQIKRQIFESRGIVDHLITDVKHSLLNKDQQ